MSRFRLLGLLLTSLVVCWSTRYACAQPTTVQLPTFQFFTTTTSVLVPDRGSTVVGGNRQGSLGSSFYSNPYLGPLRNIGTSTNPAQISVHAQVHDLQEMDRALLSQAGSQVRPPLAAAANGALQQVAPEALRSTADTAPAGSVEDAKRARIAELSAADREARGFFEQAVKAENDGRPGVARAYYQMAAGKASPGFKIEIERKLALLPQRGATARSNSPRPPVPAAMP